MWAKKIIKTLNIIKKSEPQVQAGSYNDLVYRQNLLVAIQDNPNIIEDDDYYRKIVA